MYYNKSVRRTSKDSHQRMLRKYNVSRLLYNPPAHNRGTRSRTRFRYRCEKPESAAPSAYRRVPHQIFWWGFSYSGKRRRLRCFGLPYVMMNNFTGKRYGCFWNNILKNRIYIHIENIFGIHFSFSFHKREFHLCGLSFLQNGIHTFHVLQPVRVIFVLFLITQFYYRTGIAKNLLSAVLFCGIYWLIFVMLLSTAYLLPLSGNITHKITSPATTMKRA